VSDEFTSKLNAATKTELIEYRAAARSMTVATHVIAISILLIMLFYTTPITVVPGVILVYMLAVLACLLDTTRDLIDKKLSVSTDK